jgi:hypothetical protein
MANETTESLDYIGDIGVKFEGAKKDAPQPVNFNNNSGDPDNQLTKRKLWARPNFRDDVRGGLNSAKHSILFMVVYENLSNKPMDGGWFKLASWQWNSAYIKSIEYLKNAYENSHYESITTLNDDFNAYMRAAYPNSQKDMERYAAGKTTRRSVTHPLTLNMEARLRLECLEALGWVDDEDVLDSDNYGACILSDTRTKKKAWFAVKSNTPKSVTTLDSWTEFETFDGAMAKAKEIFEKEILTARKETPKKRKERSKPPKRPCFDRPFIRQGPNYRRDEPITLEKFVETFRFRGVEFGNWVTQTERQGFLDATYDAFMDLSHIFVLPPSFASLGGALGIAFGSRGKGADNVSAHFELGQWLIHLTKTKGTGALAHEFAHALDAFLAKRNQTDTQFFTDRFINSVKGHRSYIQDNLCRSYNLRDQKMMPKFEDLLHQMIKDKGDSESHHQSSFSKSAAHLDSNSKKMYWADPTELFARAFETWMSDRLKEDGQINEFLVYGTDQSPLSWNTKVNMYPEGNERERIVAAMEEWVEALVDSWKNPAKQ